MISPPEFVEYEFASLTPGSDNQLQLSFTSDPHSSYNPTQQGREEEQLCSGFLLQMQYESHIGDGRFGYTFGYRRQFALISEIYAKLQVGMGLAGSLITLTFLFFQRLTVFSGNSKSAEGNLVGVRPPSRHRILLTVGGSERS
jgi:hypothetical protein